MTMRSLLYFSIVSGWLLGGCGEGDEFLSRPAADEAPRGLGKADGSSSCQNTCGKQARGGCWCDAQCSKHGDCCADKSLFCDAKPASCLGLCGKKHSAGCWCDATCSKYGDCCSDEAAVCDSPPPPDKCAGVTCTPTPPSCSGNDLVVSKSSSCDASSGKCVDVVQRTTCPNGCDKGACKPAPSPPSNDPMDPASCQGPLLTDVASLFTPGGVKRSLGATSVSWQGRTCNSITGCTPWAAQGSDFAGVQWAGTAELAVVNDQIWLDFIGKVVGRGDSVSVGHCKVDQGQLTCAPENYLGTQDIVMSGAIRQSCVRVHGAAQYLNPLTGKPSGSEYQVAILARF